MIEKEHSECFFDGNDREGLSPENLLRRQMIADFWSELNVSSETGATDRATLEQIERDVTEAMYRTTPDLDQAESLTFMAMHVISGNKI